jgi:hypothetical protein
MGATENGVFTLAREAGIELDAGTAFPWLSNRGHLNPILAGVAPETTLGILSTIHQRLGGDEGLLAGKRAGSSPRPDFVLASANMIVELDEIQHFTSDRLATLELYPRNVQLAFDIGEYRALIGQWSEVADRYRAAKPSADFPQAGGRRAQRAYFDAVRDLVAPSFGRRVLRVPAPECEAAIAAARLTARLPHASRSMSWPTDHEDCSYTPRCYAWRYEPT